LIAFHSSIKLNKSENKLNLLLQHDEVTPFPNVPILIYDYNHGGARKEFSRRNTREY
jgi:hypothetical protein